MDPILPCYIQLIKEWQIRIDDKLIKKSDMRQPVRTQMLAPFIWDCLIGRRDRSLLVRGYCCGRKTQEEIAAGAFACLDLSSSCHWCSLLALYR